MSEIKKIQKQTSKQRKKQEMFNDSDKVEDAGMVSNILDNILEIGSDEQSMFIHLNIRNRR